MYLEQEKKERISSRKTALIWGIAALAVSSYFAFDVWAKCCPAGTTGLVSCAAGWCCDTATTSMTTGMTTAVSSPTVSPFFSLPTSEPMNVADLNTYNPNKVTWTCMGSKGYYWTYTVPPNGQDHNYIFEHGYWVREPLGDKECGSTFPSSSTTGMTTAYNTESYGHSTCNNGRLLKVAYRPDGYSYWTDAGSCSSTVTTGTTNRTSSYTTYPVSSYSSSSEGLPPRSSTDWTSQYTTAYTTYSTTTADPCAGLEGFDKSACECKRKGGTWVGRKEGDRTSASCCNYKDSLAQGKCKCDAQGGIWRVIKKGEMYDCSVSGSVFSEGPCDDLEGFDKSACQCQNEGGFWAEHKKGNTRSGTCCKQKDPTALEKCKCEAQGGRWSVIEEGKMYDCFGVFSTSTAGGTYTSQTSTGYSSSSERLPLRSSTDWTSAYTTYPVSSYSSSSERLPRSSTDWTSQYTTAYTNTSPVYSTCNENGDWEYRRLNASGNYERWTDPSQNWRCTTAFSTTGMTTEWTTALTTKPLTTVPLTTAPRKTYRVECGAHSRDVNSIEKACRIATDDATGCFIFGPNNTAMTVRMSESYDSCVRRASLRLD